MPNHNKNIEYKLSFVKSTLNSVVQIKSVQSLTSVDPLTWSSKDFFLTLPTKELLLNLYQEEKNMESKSGAYNTNMNKSINKFNL